MKRIALLTPTFHQFSGIDRVVEDIAKRLVAQGNAVTVFCLSGSITIDGVSVVQLGMPRMPLFERLYRLFFFMDRVKIARVARMVQSYDIVYGHFYPMTCIAEAAKKRYGRTYWYHNYGIPPAHTFSSPLERLYIVVLRWLTNRTIRSADRVISISMFLADTLTRETGLSSEVEHVAIDRTRFHEGIDRMRVRSEVHLGNNPVVVYVGRISPHKGVHMLIEAFRIARRSCPDARLLIIGKPTFPAYAEQLRAAADDHVIFGGFVSDDQLPYYYAAADVYATGSMWEGYDMPIVEAQACGTRAVAFDIGAHREVIDHRGMLVPARDINAFAKALVQILTHRTV